MVMGEECSTPAAARKGAAVHSHSEAERKRRQRINAHLATLRTLVPSASRMDKAALLGEVVRHVREMRAKASDAAEGVLGILSMESDEVGVVEDEEHDDDDHWRADPHHHHHCQGGVTDRRRKRSVRAWVCSADRPGLLSDLGRAVRSAGARPVRAEIATVSGRTRSVLELDVCDDVDDAGNGDKAVALPALRVVLRNVLLDREEHLAAVAEGYKRPRFSGQIGKVL